MAVMKPILGITVQLDNTISYSEHVFKENGRGILEKIDDVAGCDPLAGN